jgi:hypothetical protein
MTISSGEKQREGLLEWDDTKGKPKTKSATCFTKGTAEEWGVRTPRSEFCPDRESRVPYIPDFL